MRKLILFFVILLEILGVIAINVAYANSNAELFAVNISIPEGLELTLNKDISVQTRDESVIIPKDTVIYPEYIFPDSTVCFHFEGIKERVHTEWENIKEQNALESLKHDAELRRAEQQKSYKARGLIIGLAEGVLWLVVVGLLSLLLMKKEKYTLLIIIHFFIILAVSIILYINVRYF